MTKRATRFDDLPLFAPDEDLAVAVCGKNAGQWPSIAALLEREGLPQIDPLFGGRYVPEDLP